MYHLSQISVNSSRIPPDNHPQEPQPCLLSEYPLGAERLARDPEHLVQGQAYAVVHGVSSSPSGRSGLPYTGWRQTGWRPGAQSGPAQGSETSDGNILRSEVLAIGRQARPGGLASYRAGDRNLSVADQIGHLGHADSLSQGDIGILAATNKLVDRVIGDLQAAGLRCQPLTRFDGRHNDRIKVGTFHRAKGLEFKVAFLLGLSEGGFPRPPSPRQGTEEYEELRSLQLSELFVAMTRARDALFLLCSREPSEVLYEALDHLDEEDHSL